MTTYDDEPVQECSTCRYWNHENDHPEDGKTFKATCSRFPPQVVIRQNVVMDVHPQTMPDQWCGEWRPVGG